MESFNGNGVQIPTGVDGHLEWRRWVFGASAGGAAGVEVEGEPLAIPLEFCASVRSGVHITQLEFVAGNIPIGGGQAGLRWLPTGGRKPRRERRRLIPPCGPAAHGVATTCEVEAGMLC